MGLNHGWDEYDGSHHADFVRGGVNEGDFADTVPHKKKSKKTKKHFKGCPENGGNAHIYVWTTESFGWSRITDEEFFKDRGFYRREYRVCCGCKKVGKSRYTEEMLKLIRKVGWYRAIYT